MRLPPVRFLGLWAAAALAGCTIEAPDFSGKSCTSSDDCPSSYTCVAARPSGGRTCEVLHLPGTGAGPGGPVPTWCKDIQPVLAASCVAACHGAVTTGSGRADFRLDVYETVGGVSGAKDMAARVHDRAAVSRSMPPPGNPMPTEDELALITRWAQGGAPRCDPTDGGS